jgi:hypothetical protein
MAARQLPKAATRASGPSRPFDGKHSSGDLLTIQELADRLTVSVGCIRAWRLRGDGPPGNPHRHIPAVGSKRSR